MQRSLGSYGGNRVGVEGVFLAGGFPEGESGGVRRGVRVCAGHKCRRRTRVCMGPLASMA